jgi:hypothetical protein
MTGILVMLNNFFHDLAVGLLAANLFVAYFYQRHADAPALRALQGRFVVYMRRITHATLGWILVGGAIRAWFFMEFEWNPAVGRGQIPALAVKHVVLFSIVIYGLLVQRRLFAQTTGSTTGAKV